MRSRRGAGNSQHGETKRSRPSARTAVSPESAVLNVLRKAGRPLRLEEVTAEFGTSGAVEAEAQLQALVKRGEVVLNRRGQYCLREQLAGLTVGTVQAHRNGDGWLLPDDGSAQIYLPAQQMRFATYVVNPDTVIASPAVIDTLPL